MNQQGASGRGRRKGTGRGDGGGGASPGGKGGGGKGGYKSTPREVPQPPKEGAMHHYPPKEMAADVGFPLRGGQTLLIAYFPWEASEADIENEFSKFCRVKRVHLVVDKSSRKPRCFGFVKFMSKADAEEALRATTQGLVQLLDTRGHVWHVKAEWTKSGDMVVDDSETEQEVAKRKEERRTRGGERFDGPEGAPAGPTQIGRGGKQGPGTSKGALHPGVPAPLPPLQPRYPNSGPVQSQLPPSMIHPGAPPLQQQPLAPPLAQGPVAHPNQPLPQQPLYGGYPGGQQQGGPFYGGPLPGGPVYGGLPGAAQPAVRGDGSGPDAPGLGAGGMPQGFPPAQPFVNAGQPGLLPDQPYGQQAYAAGPQAYPTQTYSQGAGYGASSVPPGYPSQAFSPPSYPGGAQPPMYGGYGQGQVPPVHPGLQPPAGQQQGAYGFLPQQPAVQQPPQQGVMPYAGTVPAAHSSAPVGQDTGAVAIATVPFQPAQQQAGGAPAAASATAPAGRNNPAAASARNSEYLDMVWQLSEMSLGRRDANAPGAGGAPPTQPPPPAQQPPAPPAGCNPAATAQWKPDAFGAVQPQPAAGDWSSSRAAATGSSGPAAVWNSFDDAAAKGMVDGLVGREEAAAAPPPGWR